MKTVIFDSTPNEICFANYDRVPEHEILKKVIDRLRAEGAAIGKRNMAPYCDYYKCEKDGIKFVIFYDEFEQSTTISTEKIEDARKIEKIFDENEEATQD